jgi:cell division septation protein DedD
MSTSECAAEPELADEQVELVQGAATGASKLLKGLLIGFAATVTIALALASWYVGVRIVAANEAIRASRPAPVSEAPAVIPAAQPDSTPANFWDTVAPPTPALYLEVASLGAEKDSRFVKRLERKGYQARIEALANQPAANQDDGRILIGPFSARSELEEAQSKLRSAGVLATEAAP